MGKNSKVLLDNGKEAQSSMQLYWSKAKQIQKKKQDERKNLAKEQKAGEGANKEKQASQPHTNDEDKETYMSKEAMNAVMNEKERRRHGQYSGSVISEASILNAQKAMSLKGIKIPGYSSDFISQQQVERNRREMEKRKVDAQAARERKEAREQKAIDDEQKQLEYQKLLAEGKDVKDLKPPAPLVAPPKQFPQAQQQMHRPKFQQEQETNDPFYKITESENYNPIEEHAKNMQLAQQQAELKSQQQLLKQQQSFNAPPTLPPQFPPPQLPFDYRQQQQPNMLPQFPPGMYPPQMQMGMPPWVGYPNNNMPPPPNMPLPPMMPPPQAYYPQPPQIPQQAQPTLIAPKPVVVEGESTVKKSKIDLTQKKVLFVPRSVIQTSSSSGGATAITKERKIEDKPEALGGNIKNISQAPAPKPFLKSTGGSIVSNADNQDLLKMFMSDIETINKMVPKQN